MVTELGMSDKLGLVKLGRKHEEIFLGRDISEDRDYSEEVAYAIDQEVKAIIDACYARAKEVLTENRELLDRIASILLEREVLDGSEFEALMNGEELPEKPQKTEQKTEEKPQTEDKSDSAGEPGANPDEPPAVTADGEVPDLPQNRTDQLPKDGFWA